MNIIERVAATGGSHRSDLIKKFLNEVDEEYPKASKDKRIAMLNFIDNTIAELMTLDTITFP